MHATTITNTRKIVLFITRIGINKLKDKSIIDEIKMDVM